MSGNEMILEQLKQLSKGERAALRRCAGQPLSMADGRALQALFHAMPAGTPPYEQGKWLAVLSIACLWDVEEASVGNSMARMLRAYIQKGQQQDDADGERSGTEKHSEGSGGRKSSMDDRVQRLLDARWDEDGYLAGKLSRVARMLRANDGEKMPDMDQLFNDLKRWNSDRRSVQLRWANEYYLSQEEEKPNVDRNAHA